MSAGRPRILISAGEASGDRLGAGLARALLARRPELELLGMGGEQMAAAGVRLVQDSSEVAGVFTPFPQTTCPQHVDLGRRWRVGF